VHKVYKAPKDWVLKEHKVELVLELKEHKELSVFKVLLVLVEQQLIIQTMFQKVLQTSTLQLLVFHMLTCKEQPVVLGRLLII
ncbi:MAG: hypothetical protein EBT08_14020, partial [Betaproteobacteria bacterium]|nr:hypothetical protein [Betaproteobacteria bacterium]